MSQLAGSRRQAAGSRQLAVGGRRGTVGDGVGSDGFNVGVELAVPQPDEVRDFVPALLEVSARSDRRKDNNCYHFSHEQYSNSSIKNDSNDK